MTEAYLTVLVNDSYLPGALVVGQALKDLGTDKELAILVSNVSTRALALLEEVYDTVIPVQSIMSDSLAELNDLGRPDLVSTYTKVVQWGQTQYSKLVYLDADILPLQNLDELFEIELGEYGIAAAPDAGWPDIFNSGLFVTKPSQKVFDDLILTVQTKESPSFDGGDQGLLNEYFLGEWKRLPFTYNVTPSAGYQYVPAYTKFSKDIKNVHFIGLNKPWLTRDSAVFASGSFGKGFDILTGLHKSWWNVFNKHYFGKPAGEVFEISNVHPLEDLTSEGEGHLLDIPKLENKWNELEITEPEVEEDDSIPPIFPWEQKPKVQAERSFSESTDFHV